MELLVILRMLMIGLLVLIVITQLLIPLVQGKPAFPIFRKSEKKIDDALLQVRQEIAEKEKLKELEKLNKQKAELEAEIEQSKKQTKQN